MNQLRNKNLEEVREVCSTLGFSDFKAKEIFRFIHRDFVTSFAEITILKLEERKKLEELFTLATISPARLQKGKGVVKAAFCFNDGEIAETVYMNFGKERKTICVSCQVGCPISCLFCATGGMGFIRNLSVDEILSQVYYFAKDHTISNIVFMGMGEPLLNYNNTVRAAKILNNDFGQNIAARKITISTVGIIPGIKRFADEERQIRLAWSLVAPTDEQRAKLIPYKNLASIQEIVGAFQEYQEKTRRRITIEYVVLKDINDSNDDIKGLARIAKQLDSHVNLIPYNPSPGRDFICGQIDLAAKLLNNLHTNATIRRSVGSEISAACGQLAGKEPNT